MDKEMESVAKSICDGLLSLGVVVHRRDEGDVIYIRADYGALGTIRVSLEEASKASLCMWQIGPWVAKQKTRSSAVGTTRLYPLKSWKTMLAHIEDTRKMLMENRCYDWKVRLCRKRADPSGSGFWGKPGVHQVTADGSTEACAQRIKLGTVRAFPNVAPDKAQALKPLEEAAEVFGAWQRIDRMSASFNTVDEINSRMMCDMQNDLLDEIADTIQACCNLAASLGVEDMTPYLARCEERNRKRGRYEG